MCKSVETSKRTISEPCVSFRIIGTHLEGCRFSFWALVPILKEATLVGRKVVLTQSTMLHLKSEITDVKIAPCFNMRHKEGGKQEHLYV